VEVLPCGYTAARADGGVWGLRAVAGRGGASDGDIAQPSIPNDIR